MRKHQVVGMAWSPFTRDRQPIFDHPIIKSLAEKYGVTKHQIILRWHIQRGIIPLPKANTVSHMEANIDVFDFKLTNIDMDVMELLDQQDFLEDHHTALRSRKIITTKIKIKPLISLPKRLDISGLFILLYFILFRHIKDGLYKYHIHYSARPNRHEHISLP